MSVVCVDTNVWLYALARPAQGEARKHLTARELIGGLEQPVITPQIVNELSANLLRKRGWSETELRALVGDLRTRCRYVVPGQDWQVLPIRLFPSDPVSRGRVAKRHAGKNRRVLEAGRAGVQEGVGHRLL